MVFQRDNFSIDKLIPERNHFWITVLCKSLYVFLIVKVLLSWSLVQSMLVYYPYVSHSFWGKVAYAPLFLINPFVEMYLICFIVILLFSVFIRINYISAFLICWFSISLSRLTFPISNGSDLILNLFLLIAVFMPVWPSSKHPGKKAFQEHISAIAILFARIELALIYFLSGYDKLISEAWRSGAAIYSVMNLDLYYNPFYKFNSNETVYALLGWGVIIFELGFAVLIWFRNFRNMFLLGGVLFHLYIIVALGLYDFGLLMIITYSVFLPKRNVSREEQLGADRI